MSSRRHKLIAFLPAMVVIGIVAVTASGLSIIPGAGAASTMTVTGNVVAGMSIAPDTSTACGGAATTGLGNFSLGTPIVGSTQCTVSFATNSVNGANVSIVDNDATAPFFCTTGCSGNSAVENVTGAVGGAVLADDTFGVALTAVAGTPAPAAPALGLFELDAAPLSTDSIWAPVGAAAAPFCATTAVTTTTQSCTIAFGVDGQGATQTAGSYTGTASITATANP